MSEVIITNNSRERAVTTNYFDGGKRYAYRITGGSLEFRIDSGRWDEFPLFDGCRVENVAADNNRVFIKTTDGRLYWRCVKEDSASWVVLVFTLASLIGDTAAGQLVWDEIAEDQRQIEGDSRPDLAAWAADYRTWVLDTHNPDRGELPGKPYLKGKGWNCLGQRLGLDTERDVILDIAVGNWNNTVVTYYVLVNSAKEGRPVLYFIDEETIMPEWQRVPGQDGRVAGNSRIGASHSVVAVATGADLHWIRMDAHQPGHIDIWPLNWTEWWNDKLPHLDLITQPFDLDGRQPPLTPRDTLEQAVLCIPPFDVLNADNYPGWHKVTADVPVISEFLIDVGYGKRPWPVPEPGLFPRLPLVDLTRIAGIAWRLYLLVAAYSAVIDQMRGQEGGTEIGFLGENPIKPNSSYPVCCIIKSGDSYKAFAIPDARQVGDVEWKDISIETPARPGLGVRQALAGLCRQAYDLQSGCFDLANKTFVCEDSGYERCAREEDRGYSECSRREDQGYQECSRREDHGHRDCCDWIPCSWVCDSWVWVSHVVCVAWTWVSNWVCVAWTWVSNIVCVAWEWVSYVTCATAKAAVKAACSFVAGGLKTISCWAISCWDNR